MTSKHDIISKIAINYFNLVDPEGKKLETVTSNNRLLRAALDHAFEQGQYYTTSDTLEIARAIAMAPSPPRKR